MGWFMKGTVIVWEEANCLSSFWKDYKSMSHSSPLDWESGLYTHTKIINIIFSGICIFKKKTFTPSVVWQLLYQALNITWHLKEKEKLLHLWKIMDDDGWGRLAQAYLSTTALIIITDLPSLLRHSPEKDLKIYSGGLILRCSAGGRLAGMPHSFFLSLQLGRATRKNSNFFSFQDLPVPGLFLCHYHSA